MEIRLLWLIHISLFLFIVFMIAKIAPYFVPVWALIKVLMIPILIAIVISYLLHPLVCLLERQGLSRFLSVVTIFLTVIMLIVFICIVIFPIFIKQIQLAMAELPLQIQQLELLADRFQAQVENLPRPLQMHTFEWLEKLDQVNERIVNQMEEGLFTFIRSSFSLVIIPFLIFYFLKDWRLIQRVGWYITPKKWRRRLSHIMKDIDTTFGHFLRGQLLISVILGGLATIGLFILDVPYPVVLGAIIGIADLIPYFGAFIGAAPALIVALLQSWKLALFTLILIFVLQQIEGNVLSPLIVGKTLALHPVLVMLALLIGIEVGGIFGVLIAVPVLAIGKVIAVHFKHALRQ